MSKPRKVYGVPYKGSKNAIAEKIIDTLPAADTLVDVFAGGCAVTHCAMLSGKWGRVIANDISDAPQLFLDAINGKYADERRWISREEFFAYKDTDPYIGLCWSFGNDRRTYLYGKSIESYKKACFEMLICEDPYERMLKYKRVIFELAKIGLRIQTPPTETSVKRLSTSLKCAPHEVEALIKKQNTIAPCSCKTLETNDVLQRLQRLKNLSGIKSRPQLEIRKQDYRDLAIPKGAVIYADKPYASVSGFNAKNKADDFDHEAFYEWALETGKVHPVYISEYTAPKDSFVCVKEWDSLLKMQSGQRSVKERLFVPKTCLQSFQQTLTI